jgi:hypothetical protein
MTVSCELASRNCEEGLNWRVRAELFLFCAFANGTDDGVSSTYIRSSNSSQESSQDQPLQAPSN